MTGASGSAEQTVQICNKRGLHARASARFAERAGQFSARIHVSKDGAKAVGTSIMGLLMLAAAPGDSVTISGEGADADVAVATLAALVASRFEEAE